MAVTIKLFVYKICISQNTTIFIIQQSLCVLNSDIFRPRIGHSQALNNSTQRTEGHNAQVVV